MGENNDETIFELTNSTNNADTMIGMLVITSILVFINIFSVVVRWIKGKDREIAVRTLSGASNLDIIRWLLLQYLFVVTISFIIGLFFVEAILIFAKFIPFAKSVIALYGDTLNLQSILLGYAITFFIGTVSGGYVILRNRKNVVRFLR